MSFFLASRLYKPISPHFFKIVFFFFSFFFYIDLPFYCLCEPLREFYRAALLAVDIRTSFVFCFSSLCTFSLPQFFFFLIDAIRLRFVRSSCVVVILDCAGG